MPKRPMNSHSLEPGDSIYPIKEGHILKLLKPYKAKNRKIGAYIEHDTYLWIMRIHKGPKKLQPKERPILITKILIPTIKNLKSKYIIEKIKVQKETISKYLLNYGYEVWDKEVYYNYRRHDFYKFYVSIGLIRKPNHFIIGLNTLREATL